MNLLMVVCFRPEETTASARAAAKRLSMVCSRDIRKLGASALDPGLSPDLPSSGNAQFLRHNNMHCPRPSQPHPPTT